MMLRRLSNFSSTKYLCRLSNVGLGLRIFIINDDDTVKRFPVSKYERLLRDDPKERLLQYAGKKIRFAELAVEFYQWKPIKIIRLLPFILHFDSGGSIDAREMQKERSLAMEAHPLYHAEEGAANVIDARHYFARKRYNYEYRWKLTEKIVSAIATALFG